MHARAHRDGKTMKPCDALFLVGTRLDILDAQPQLQPVPIAGLQMDSVRAELRSQIDQGSEDLCWLVVGDPPGQWLETVETLRDGGFLDTLPWALWLGEESKRSDVQRLAWDQGALEIIDCGDASSFAHHIESLCQRLRAPTGPLADLRRMRLENATIRSTLNNIPAPIFVKDTAGKYTECNEAFLEYLGLPREQVIGHTVYDVAPPALAQVYDEADRRLLEGGARQIYDTQVRWADGALREVTFYKSVIRDHRGAVLGQAGAIFDVTERKHLENTLRVLSETDPLTGILNRRSFIEQAALRLGELHMKREPVVLILFDIDHFKQLNDTHGHVLGDAVLRELSGLVTAHLRTEDLFARIGGDEFAILLKGLPESHSVEKRLPTLVASQTFATEHGGQQCTISLGAVRLVPTHVDVDALLAHADQALYEAKRQGRNTGIIRSLPAAQSAAA